MEEKWWKEAVVYQIYPRSFNDSNGDGIGDLQGIIDRLGYIQSLGVDVIWLCPIYESPNDDNGYDISDYRKIMSDFGTMEDFDNLLKDVHGRGMKLIMDLVANHSSDEHAWFKESRKSKNNPYRDYYIWKPGKTNAPPNNYPSFFGGDAWEYDETTDEYYLHLFTRKQPDLNWENPKVRKEIYDIMHYWLGKGIDGFRMDVISVISKQLDYPNTDLDNFNDIVDHCYANGPKVHSYLREMNQAVLSMYDMMTVGEGPGIAIEQSPKYVNHDRDELDMVFHFDHMHIDAGSDEKYEHIPYTLDAFRDVFSKWDTALKDKGWGSIFLGNHDYPRLLSRFGNDSEYRTESAKLFAMLLLSLRGTTYIYQGDEIGMCNVAFPSIDNYRDVDALNAWREAEKNGKDMAALLKRIHINGRDNARTPMQWGASDFAGFSSGRPWIDLNPNYSDINVEKEEGNKDSILHFYRKMIHFRKENKTLVYGDYKTIDKGHEKLFAYLRYDADATFAVFLNFSLERIDVEVDMPEGARWHLIISNYQESGERLSGTNVMLQPWQSCIYKKV